MRKNPKGLIFIFLITSIVLPTLFSVVVKAETEEEDIPVFIVGTAGPTDITNWDMPCYGVSTGDYYMGSALEYLFALPYGSDGSTDDLKPILATDWDIENRPNEMNIDGFVNYGGIRSIELTLRENVTFHDGSPWNATVCKWNIDRQFVILGNITGCLPISVPYSLAAVRGLYWLKVSDWDDYETASWNVSEITKNAYAEYGVSGDYGVGIVPSRFPRYENVTITENKTSGGKVRVYFNDWGHSVNYLQYFRFISMRSYHDYFFTPIYGYGDETAFPQDDPATFPGHLIGTGPYIFEGHNFVSDTGRMIKNGNWWNTTAQQADGWHTIPEVSLIAFSHDSLGYGSRSTAMTTGDIHWAHDRSWEPLSYDEVISAGKVKYTDMGLEAYGENIFLNCINETFYRVWAETGYNVSLIAPYIPSTFKLSGNMNADGTINAHGPNRAFRKAISYAFDYDTYLTTTLEGRAERSGGFLPTTNEYYDPSVPLAYRNLTIARQALLDDPYWSARCAAKGLNMSSSDQDWIDVAESTDPVYKFEFSFDQAHIGSRSILELSLKDIGCGMTELEDIPETYSKMTVYYTFPWYITDGFALKPTLRDYNCLGYISAYYKSSGIYDSTYLGKPYSARTPYTLIFPYGAGGNMGFNYNTTSDEMIDKLWFQNSTGAQDKWSELIDWAQNYQYMAIFLAQNKIGHAINKDWDYGWYWPVFRYNLVKYTPRPDQPIPGFSIGIVISASLVALLGIVYTIMRKKRYM